MNAEPTAAETASPPVPTPAGSDERLARISRLTRALQRPELGALLGAVAIFLLFAATDSTTQHLWLTQTGIAAWSAQAAFFGIMAVPVGLLMIGGEFDLSAGVMTGATAIVMALLVGRLHWNAWLAIAGTLVFAGADRAAQRLRRGEVEAAELHRHARDLLRPARHDRRRGPAAQPRKHPGGADRHLASRPGSAKAVFGSSFGASASLRSGYQTAVLWFVAVTLVAAWVLCAPRSATGSSPRAATPTRRATLACRSTGPRFCFSSAPPWRPRSSGSSRSPRRRRRCPNRASATSSSTSSRRWSAAACSPAGTAPRSVPRSAPASSAWRSKA